MFLGLSVGRYSVFTACLHRTMPLLCERVAGLGWSGLARKWCAQEIERRVRKGRAKLENSDLGMKLVG